MPIMKKKFDLRGLLYSPEVLGGMGLLGQGFSGQAPSVQPIMQGMQTANMFDLMNKRNQRDQWAAEYADTLPEGSVLKDIFKFSPDKGIDFIKETEVAKINAQSKTTTAYKNAISMGLIPNTPEFNKYMRAATIQTDEAAKSYQNMGVVQGGSARDKLVKDIEVVTNVKDQLDNVLIQKLKEDPTLSGGVGWIRKKGNAIGTFLKDMGVDARSILPDGISEEFIFDKDINTITALENTLAAAYAKILYPGQKITNKQIDIAKDVVGIRNLEGSDAVINRLEQVSKEMSRFINSYQSLLGGENNTNIISDSVITIEELKKKVKTRK